MLSRERALRVIKYFILLEVVAVSLLAGWNLYQENLEKDEASVITDRLEVVLKAIESYRFLNPEVIGERKGISWLKSQSCGGYQQDGDARLPCELDDTVGLTSIIATSLVEINEVVVGIPPIVRNKVSQIPLSTEVQKQIKKRLLGDDRYSFYSEDGYMGAFVIKITLANDVVVNKRLDVFDFSEPLDGSVFVGFDDSRSEEGMSEEEKKDWLRKIVKSASSRGNYSSPAELGSFVVGLLDAEINNSKRKGDEAGVLALRELKVMAEKNAEDLIGSKIDDTEKDEKKVENLDFNINLKHWR